MSEIKWIKITTDMFDDEKIDFISSLPEGDSLIIVWVRLLTMAGKNNASGFIFLTENIPYSEDMLSHKFKKPLNVIKLALKTFKELNMVEFDESGKIIILNWDKHQNIEGMDKIREQNRLRKQKEREIKQLSRDCHVTVTEECHADSRDLSNSNSISNSLDSSSADLTECEKKIMQELKNTVGYSFDYCKDLNHIRSLIIEFPDKDLLEIIKKWKTWLLDKPLKKNSNPRSQIRNWVKNEKPKNISNINYKKSPNSQLEYSYQNLPDM